MNIFKLVCMRKILLYIMIFIQTGVFVQEALSIKIIKAASELSGYKNASSLSSFSKNLEKNLDKIPFCSDNYDSTYLRSTLRCGSGKSLAASISFIKNCVRVVSSIQGYALVDNCKKEEKKLFSNDSVAKVDDYNCQDLRDVDIIHKKTDLSHKIGSVCSVEDKVIDPELKNCESDIMTVSWVLIDGDFFFYHDLSLTETNKMNDISQFECTSEDCNKKCSTGECFGDSSYCRSFSGCSGIHDDCYCTLKENDFKSIVKFHLNDQTFVPSCWGSSRVKVMRQKQTEIKISDASLSKINIECVKKGLMVKIPEAIKIQYLSVCDGRRCLHHENLLHIFLIPHHFRGQLLTIKIYFDNLFGHYHKTFSCPNIEGCYYHEMGLDKEINCYAPSITEFLSSIQFSFFYFRTFSIILFILLICFLIKKILKENFPNLNNVLNSKFKVWTRKLKEKIKLANVRRQQDYETELPLVQRPRNRRFQFYNNTTQILSAASLASNLSSANANPLNFLSKEGNDMSGIDELSFLIKLILALMLIKVFISVLNEIQKLNKFFTLIVFSLILFSGLKLVNSSCSETTVLKFNSEDCTKIGNQLNCELKFNNLIKLPLSGNSFCLVSKKGNSVLGLTKITSNYQRYVCKQKTLYYTFNPSVNSISLKSCSHSGICKGDKCHSFNKDSNQRDVIWPQHKGKLTHFECSPSCGCFACGCFYCTEGCLYKSAIIENLSKEVFRVFKCDWFFELSLSVQIPGEKELEINLNKKSVSKGIFEIDILSVSSPEISRDSCFLDKEGIISEVDCQDSDQLSKGSIGEIRCQTEHSAKNPNNEQCQFDSSTVKFWDLEDRSEVKSELLDISNIHRKNLLPRMSGGTVVKMEKDSKGTNIVLLNDQEFLTTINIKSKAIELKYAVEEVSCFADFVSLEGCYDCINGSSLKLRMRSSLPLFKSFISCHESKIFSPILITNVFKEYELKIQAHQSKIKEVCVLQCSKNDVNFEIKGDLKFVQKTLVPVLKKIESSELNSSEGNWADVLNDLYESLKDKFNLFGEVWKLLIVFGSIILILIFMVLIFKAKRYVFKKNE